MATESELMDALRNADAAATAGDKSAAADAQQLAQSISRIRSAAKTPAAAAPSSGAGAPPVNPVEPQAPMSADANAYRTNIYNEQAVPGQDGVITRMLGGAKARFDQAAAGVKGLLPQGVQDAGDKLDEVLTGRKQLTPELLSHGRAYSSQAGTPGKLGSVATDAGLALATDGASRAGAISDIAGQGLLNYATTPGDPEERTDALQTGAGATAAGRGAIRLLGGPLRPAVTPEARKLLDSGVTPTPAGLLSGESSNAVSRAARSVEDKSKSFPGVGDVIQNRSLGSTKDYNKAEINAALAPLNAKIMLTGNDGLDKAHDIVSKTLAATLPEIQINGAVARPTIQKVIDAAHNDPLMDAGQMNKLNRVMGIKIEPIIKAGQAPLTGAQAQSIDDYLTDTVRRAQGPGNAQLRQYLGDLQGAWRKSMQGSTPSSRDTLDAVNDAYDKLRVLQKAAPEGGSGLFTPKDVIKASSKSGITPSDLSVAASRVLPDTVPDTGTAGRSLLARGAGLGGAVLGLGGHSLGSGTAEATGAALAGSAAMYSKPGIQYLANGVRPATDALYNLMPKGVQETLSKLKPADSEAMLRQITTRMLRGGANADMKLEID